MFATALICMGFIGCLAIVIANIKRDRERKKMHERIRIIANRRNNRNTDEHN